MVKNDTTTRRSGKCSCDSNGNSSPTQKKKTKMKQEKETKQLFEKIAKRLSEESAITTKQQLKSYCDDIVSKSFHEFRQDLIMIESSLASRISQMDLKVSSCNNKISEIQAEYNQKFNNLKEDINSLSKSTSDNIEKERSKRLALIKKIQVKEEETTKEFNNAIDINQQEVKNILTNLSEEYNSQTKEISRLRENVDDMLLKRYGFIPGTKSSSENLTASFNQGLDAGLVLDTLANRIKELECHIMEQENTPPEDIEKSLLHIKGSIIQSSPLKKLKDDNKLKSNLKNNSSSSLLEQNMKILQSDLKECEIEIKQIKLHMGMNKDSSLYNYNSSPEKNEKKINNNHQDLVEEVKTLKRKTKKLAENTTKACRSLSNGLSDIQQATLNLYSWADKAHDSFGIISERLSFSVNMCPRAKVYNPNSHGREYQFNSFDL